MPKKLLMILLPVLLLAGGGYFFFLRGGGEEKKEPKHKVEGVLMTLQPEFLLNLSDGHMAKFQVTLLLKEDDHGAMAITEASGGGHGPVDPSKLPAHPQNSVIRSIITDEVNSVGSEEMMSPTGRKKLGKEIVHHLEESSDAHVKQVLFSDVVVD